MVLILAVHCLIIICLSIFILIVILLLTILWSLPMANPMNDIDQCSCLQGCTRSRFLLFQLDFLMSSFFFLKVFQFAGFWILRTVQVLLLFRFFFLSWIFQLLFHYCAHVVPPLHRSHPWRSWSDLCFSLLFLRFPHTAAHTVTGIWLVHTLILYAADLLCSLSIKARL